MIASAFFHEPRAEEARALILGGDLFAPQLLPFEVANVARKKMASRPNIRKELAADLRDALGLPIAWVEIDHAAVVELAVERGLTTYDASYLYVARVLDAPLVTFDKRLASASGS